jgi:hypothetical protein
LDARRRNNMSIYTTTTTFDTVGVKTITPNFQSSGITISVAPAVGESFQGVQHCFGWTDGIRKMCDFQFANLQNNNAISGKTTSKLVQLWGEDVNGHLAIVLEATLNSITATQVKFDVTTASIDYQVSIKCDG